MIRPVRGVPPAGSGSHRPNFLITVDTEGDDLWSRPRVITTRNTHALPRFQALCESYGLRPTYLVNYEMATSPVFQEFGRDVLRRRAGEIGMHLHAWNTPPLVPLTQDDLAFQPYLIEYPAPIIRQKISVLTSLLEETFGVKMISHRAGRWGFNEVYAQSLAAHGYRVDCSVTPLVSWRQHLGDPRGTGGSDYSRYPSEPYFVDLDDVSRPGDSSLLEIPMTIVPSRWPAMLRPRTCLDSLPLARRAMNRFFPPVYWLRPDRRNGHSLVRIVRRAARQRKRCVEFMLHSSDLIAGGSPFFPRVVDVERLYRTLSALFAEVRQTCVGATLCEHYEQIAADRATAG
jgi:hypothetical protein